MPNAITPSDTTNAVKLRSRRQKIERLSASLNKFDESLQRLRSDLEEASRKALNVRTRLRDMYARELRKENLQRSKSNGRSLPEEVRLRLESVFNASESTNEKLESDARAYAARNSKYNDD